MPELMAQRDAFGKALVDLGALNDRVVVIDADLASSTKANMFEAAYPERFFQMGVTEQNVMGVAAGLATMGFVPFANTFACFATKRALDQIRISIAQPRLHVIVIGAYANLFVGKSGKTHQVDAGRGHHARHAQHDRRGAGRRRRSRARRSSPSPSTTVPSTCASPATPARSSSTTTTTSGSAPPWSCARAAT